MYLRAITLAVAIVLSNAVAIAADVGETQFEQRCAQCHDAADPSIPARAWFARLQAMGPLSELDMDQRVEIVDFLRNHERRTTEMVALAEEKRLFERKCSICHTTERVFLEPLTQEARRHIVLRMQERAAEWITPDEAERILAFLNQTQVIGLDHIPEALREPAAAFRDRCTACHALERVYLHLEASGDSGAAWLHIVQRMRSKAPDWIDEEEVSLILEYLDRLEPVNP